MTESSGTRSTINSMKKVVLIALIVLSGCSHEAPDTRMVRSEMERNPKATYIDGMEGKMKWNYTTGLELLAFMDLYDFKAPYLLSKGDTTILDYVDAWYDEVIDSEGHIGANYKKSNYNLDHICPARTLFLLKQHRPKEKYSLAIEEIASQLKTQPRTKAGAFWHKKVYPNQVWLDGLYMAEPFYAMWASTQPEPQRDSLFSDIALQFKVAAEKTYDPSTGLYRHAWDESREMFWCDKETGQSAHSWGRAMGWYAMALVDVLDYFPKDHPERKELLDILSNILETLPKYADPKTGMWYQVLDSPGREGNYTEATCSAMFSYVYLKSTRKGYYVDEEYAKSTYENLYKTFIRKEKGGRLTLIRCCAVAGLGGKDNRSGDYDYYINEKITDNDPKGIGPFIWATYHYGLLTMK